MKTKRRYGRYVRTHLRKCEFFSHNQYYLNADSRWGIAQYNTCKRKNSEGEKCRELFCRKQRASQQTKQQETFFGKKLLTRSVQHWLLPISFQFKYANKLRRKIEQKSYYFSLDFYKYNVYILLGPPGRAQAFPNLRPGLLNCWRGTGRVKITRELNLSQDQQSVPHNPGE